MMVDLALFADEKYDAKAWLNAACRERLPDDPVDRYLTDLEMKLQLMAETITADLDELSAGALLRVPRASRDVLRVRDDAITLRSTVSAILAKLKQAEGTSAESVAALARVDIVKQRMEAAHETLQDAAGLAKLSASVEEVFASGDLPRAAETLANMRRCLAVVGEVPEFANVKRELEVLEDRLEAMVQPRLADALSQRKVDSTQGLRDILIRIGRYSSLEQHYTRVRVRPLRRLWEEFEAGKGSLPVGKSSANDKQSVTLIVPDNESVSFVEWLPKFYDEVLVQLEQELKWEIHKNIPERVSSMMPEKLTELLVRDVLPRSITPGPEMFFFPQCTIAFPEDYKLLVPRLLIETMSAISSSFAARIDAASQESGSDSQNGGVEEGRSSGLGTLIALHNVTGKFAKNVQHLLYGIDLAEVARVLTAVYTPYEGYKQRYGELERVQLLGDISAMDLRVAVPRGLGQKGVELSETVGRMDASIPKLILLLEAAVDRCLSFTGGSEAEALLRTLDEVMLQYLASLMEILKSMRPLCGVEYLPQDTTKKEGTGEAAIGRKDSLNMSGSTAEVVPEEEEWPIVQGTLQFLTVADSLSARSSIFEASLHSVLNRISAHLQLSSTSVGQGGPNSTETETKGEGAGPLDMAILRLTDAPDKERRLATLFEQAKDPRFHSLPQTAQRLSAFLEAVNDLVYEVLISKVRSKLTDVARMPVWCAEEEDNVFDLPSFSAYPLPYVTSIGEYLFTLPQQLEPLASGTGVGDENADEAQYIATEWMFKVAEGATALYVDQIRGIHALNERGAQQLSADIEYLCNVLSALSMTTPLVLSTFQTCVAAPRDKLPELAKQEGIDNASFRLVCKMRGVPLE